MLNCYFFPQLSCIISTTSFMIRTCSKTLEAVVLTLTVGCMFDDIQKAKAWTHIFSNGIYVKNFL